MLQIVLALYGSHVWKMENLMNASVAHTPMLASTFHSEKFK